MTQFFRRVLAAAALVLAAAPARAQDADAWVLPRRQIEVAATGSYTYYDHLLGDGDPALGASFVAPFQRIASELAAEPAATLASRLQTLFTNTSLGPLPEELQPGTTTFRLRADIRQIPLSVRYGLTDRLTLFVTVPFERRGSGALGPYLVGGNVGVNPNPTANAAALARLDSAYVPLGGGTLLPSAESATGRALQALLRQRGLDTLVLPTRLLAFSDFRADGNPFGELTDAQAAAFDSLSNRRGYRLGDVEVGARMQVLGGRLGWPQPDTVARWTYRTAVGVRGRLPTGPGATTFLTELVPGGGHFGVGVDVFNDVFLSRHWWVSAAARYDVRFPADVQALAFTEDEPFPAPTDVVTLRREPGAELALSVVPRWRLTREISFAGQYAFTHAGETTYSGADGILPPPTASDGPWTAHAVGLGARYSTLGAWRRGTARVPIELDLSFLSTFAGSGGAPRTGQVRITARFLPQNTLLPGPSAPDSVPPPPPVPADSAATDTTVTPPASSPRPTTPAQTQTIPTSPRPVAEPPREKGQPAPVRPPR